MKMSEYRPRVPEANRHNVVEFCAAYMSTYGGDIRNAYKCWQYDIWERERKNVGRSRVGVSTGT